MSEKAQITQFSALGPEIGWVENLKKVKKRGVLAFASQGV